MTGYLRVFWHLKSENVNGLSVGRGCKKVTIATKYQAVDGGTPLDTATELVQPSAVRYSENSYYCPFLRCCCYQSAC